MSLVSVIVPAHDESATIAASLSCIAAQRIDDHGVEVLVMANGCTDDTVAVARSMEPVLREAGMALRVHDLPTGSKTLALNAGDADARGDVLFYCDADISMAPGTMAAMVDALADRSVALVSASQRCVEPHNRVVRGWARCYHASPYQRGTDVVHGLYALTREARDRFGDFPATMADDRYLSLNYATSERRRVAEAVIDIRYTESARELIDQQARWIANNGDIDRRYPELLAANAPSHNEQRWPYFVAPRPGWFDIVCYGSVMVAARVRLWWRRSAVLSRWDRARP